MPNHNHTVSNNATAMADSDVPNFVVLDLMYRDAANWKKSQSFGFANDSKLTKAQILTWLDTHLPTEDVLASDFNLPNLAPLDSLYDTNEDNDDDHCFMEVDGVDLLDVLHDLITPSNTLFSAIVQKGTATSMA